MKSPDFTHDDPMNNLPAVPSSEGTPKQPIILPREKVITRRDLMKYGVAAILGISASAALPWKETWGAEDERLSTAKIDELFLKANEHEFMKDPQGWWGKNRARVKKMLEKKIEKCECLECIDDGVQEEGDTISEAGSGILYQITKYPAMKDRRKAYAENLHNCGIKPKKITSHYSCGGAAAAAELQGYKNSSDQFGMEWSQALATDMGAEYEHIGREKMDRPSIHDVTGLLYSPGAVPHYKKSGLPKLMKINRDAIEDDAHAQAELELAAKILKGNEGFGPRFNKEKPLRIIVPYVERDAVLSEKAIAEATKLVEKNEDLKLIVLE